MGIHTFMFLLLNALLYFSNGDQPVEEEPIKPPVVKEILPRPRPGSRYQMNPRRSKAIRMATKAVEEFNKKSSPEENFKLEKVTSITGQSTYPPNYKIEAVIGKTECLKSDEKSDEEPDTESCVLGKKDERTCTFMLAFLDEDEYELFYSSCKE